MPLLEIKNLSAGYGNLQVLFGVSLGLEQGEMVALLGPNGAGKSTVLRSVAGLSRIFNGTILFKGKDITRLPTHTLLEEGIAFVPQGRLVFPSLTVEENLEMGGYLIDRKETLHKNKEDIFSRFPALKGKRREKAGTLSGGQQQMLAVGRALMMTPELLMLDEPSLGLSPKVIGEIFEKLKEIQKSGTTIFLVEQNVRLALQYAERGYLLASGTIRFEGKSSELANLEKMRALYLGG